MTRAGLLKTGILSAMIVLATVASAVAQAVPMAPLLRPTVSVSGELVRIGDFIDNAGEVSQIALFRSPDIGTTGSVSVSQIVEALRAHHVIGVVTNDLHEVQVTREARTLSQKEIETEVARALERRGGLGKASDISVTFDREVRIIQLDAAHRGGLTPAAVRYEPRNARFDVTFEIARESGVAPTRLRFSGMAVEMVEAAVVTRRIERGEILKRSDVATERRPRSDVGADLMPRERAVGMQTRRSLRAGQNLSSADLAKADLVQRDQTVMLIYEAPGVYLTVRGKAVESGSEGDTVSVMNLQSKRTVQGTVVGPGQVSMSVIAPRLAASLPQELPAAASPTTE